MFRLTLGNLMGDAGERAPDGVAVKDDLLADRKLLLGLTGPG